MRGWTESENDRLINLGAKMAVVANISKDKRLIAWAKEHNLYTRIDRKTKWGNPFEVPRDGNRREVCALYEDYYWEQPHLQQAIGELRGHVLGCWCYPERCHGDFLASEAWFDSSGFGVTVTKDEEMRREDHLMEMLMDGAPKLETPREQGGHAQDAGRDTGPPAGGLVAARDW